MVTVYRPDGVEEEKTSVDTRECVEHCGYTYEPPVDFVDVGSSSLQTEGGTVNIDSTDAGSSSLQTEGDTGNVDSADAESSSLQAEDDTKKAAGKGKKSAAATVEQIHDPNS